MRLLRTITYTRSGGSAGILPALAGILPASIEFLRYSLAVACKKRYAPTLADLAMADSLHGGGGLIRDAAARHKQCHLLVIGPGASLGAA